MADLKQRVNIKDATSGHSMTLRVVGVRRWTLRMWLSLRIIKLAQMVSPIVTRVVFDD